MDNDKETLYKLRSWQINSLGDTLDLYKSSYPDSKSYFLACNNDTSQSNEVDHAWSSDNLFSYTVILDSLSRQFNIECKSELIKPIADEANLLVLLYL